MTTIHILKYLDVTGQQEMVFEREKDALQMAGGLIQAELKNNRVSDATVRQEIRNLLARDDVRGAIDAWSRYQRGKFGGGELEIFSTTVR